MKWLYKKTGNILYILLLPVIRLVIRRTLRVHVAITYQGKILLIKSWLARDTWRLPGGGVRKSESPEDAAVREIHEELGIVLEATQLVRISEGTMSVDKLGYRFVSFSYDLEEQPAIVADVFEIIEYGLFSSLPANSQHGLAEVIVQLEEEKLL